jgi:ankyrin repeat protein
MPSDLGDPHGFLFRSVLGFLMLWAGFVRAGENPAFDDEQSVWYQARKGQLEALRKSLDENPEWLNARDPLKRTPLFYAAKSGRVAAARFLLEQKDVETDAVDAYGRTAWHWTAMYGHVDVLQLMDEYDIDVNMRGKHRNTPLHLSLGNAFSNAHRRHPQVVRLLLKMGADPNARNDAQETPLLTACTLVGRRDALEVLLGDKRTEVDAQDKNGDTALHRAVGWGLVPFVETLLAHGADASRKNKQGETPRDRLTLYKRITRPDTERVAREIEQLLETSGG